MMRYDPVTLEDLSELFGPGGRMAMIAGAIACTALVTPAIAESPQASVAAAATASATAPRGAVPAVPENRAEIAANDLDTLAVPVVAVRRPSAMTQEIDKVLDEERKALADLRARFAAAPSAKVALEVQREIEQLKVGTEVALLRVQVAFARRDGRLEDARRIEADIEEALHPRNPVGAAGPARRSPPTQIPATPR